MINSHPKSSIIMAKAAIYSNVSVFMLGFYFRNGIQLNIQFQKYPAATSCVPLRPSLVYWVSFNRARNNCICVWLI